MDYRRIRLHLDFPSLELNQKCWLLFDITRCKSISDLSYLIKKRFNLSKPMTLNLTLDDFLLPALESIHVVRDNDVIHVTSAVMSCTNDSILQNGHVKRTNSVSDHSFSLSPPPARKKQTSGSTKVTNKKSTKRKHSDSNSDVISNIQSTEPTLMCKISPEELKSRKSMKSSTKEKKTTNVSNSVVTSNTKKTKTLLKSGGAAGEMTVVQPNQSSLMTQSNVRSNHIYFNNSSDENDDLDEHIEQQENQCTSISPNIRSDIVPASSSIDSETTRTQQLDHISMPSETQQATDYSSLPTLITVPNIGDRIAFKTLELSSDYTPILSHFKEGTIISFNLVQQSFVIELSDQALKLEEMKLKEHSSGKFALPEPLPEVPEKNIEIEFKDLIEPKLLI